MKVLYAIQATGNGHITRAEVFIPLLQKFAEIDILISGNSSEIDLSHPVKYKFYGLSFIFGKNGGINFWKTLQKIKIFRFIKDVRRLKLDEYDFVLNDFEPVSAWACFVRKKHSIALSHQYSLLNPKVPTPKKNSFLGEFILKYYSPCSIGYGFHFERYSNEIFYPIIKNDLKNKNLSNQNFYLVYLPAFGDEKIISILSKVDSVKWIIFSKNAKKNYSLNNIEIIPISSRIFGEKIIYSKGVLCGGGFETPSEALYLKKKLIVVPMKNQFEQQCNAEALKKMGVQILYEFNQDSIKQLERWVESDNIIDVDYSEDPIEVIQKVFSDYRKRMTVLNSRQLINEIN